MKTLTLGKNSIRSLAIFINNECNLNCTYCYVNKNNNLIKASPLIKDAMQKTILFFLKSTEKNKKIIITGGEPLIEISLLLKYLKMIRALLKKTNSKVDIVLNTNGTLFNKTNQKKLFHLLDKISISIDGREATHDLCRKDLKGNGTYKTIMRNIAAMNLSWRNKLNIFKVVNSENYKTFYQDMIYLISLNPRELFFTAAMDDEDWNNTKLRYLFSQAEKLYKWIKAGLKKRKIKKSMIRKYMLDNPAAEECVLSYITVDQKGEIFPCEILLAKNKYAYGNIAKGTFRKDLLECYFDRENKRCVEQYCRKCNTLCWGEDLEKQKMMKKALGLRSYFYQRAKNDKII
ncbi:MAG: 4Fe-4S cluster-binding domain-containing protein [Candidatus Margulisbacteria bacterium]|nr:4Fe-4S cluster-binding domain-containing protein [Candidatus Margulisiibacteriota bacterium]